MRLTTAYNNDDFLEYLTIEFPLININVFNN